MSDDKPIGTVYIDRLYETERYHLWNAHLKLDPQLFRREAWNPHISSWIRYYPRTKVATDGFGHHKDVSKNSERSSVVGVAMLIFGGPFLYVLEGEDITYKNFGEL